MKQFREDFFARIKDAKNVIVVSHPSPDEDSIASVLTMRAIVSEHAPEAACRVMYAQDAGTGWGGLLGSEHIESAADVDGALAEADRLIILDANNYPRVGISDEAWDTFEGQKMCIDHHEGNESAFDLSYIDHTATSVAELIYHLFYADADTISREVSDLLLLGILGDTGMLSFVSPDTVDVLNVVHRLISESGSDIADLQSRYLRRPVRSMDVFLDGFSHVHLLENKSGGTCFALFLSDDIQEQTGLTALEVNQAKDYLITKYSGMFEGVTWGFVVYCDEDGVYSISFRSRHEGVDVRTMIDTLGLRGGGHAWASGAEFKEEFDSVEDAFEELIKRLQEKNIIT